jgi:hypothetical protein
MATAPPFPAFVLGYYINGIGVALQVCLLPFSTFSRHLIQRHYSGLSTQWLRRVSEAPLIAKNGHPALRVRVRRTCCATRLDSIRDCETLVVHVYRVRLTCFGGVYTSPGRIPG